MASDAISRWYALEVKRRFEKHTASMLVAKGFEQYLPTYCPDRQWKHRKAKLNLALFPGYVFCRFNETQRLPVLTTPGVYRIVSCSNKPAPVDERELDSIRRLVASALALQTCDYVALGDRVTIHTGPLKGVEGLIVGFNKNCRLVVSVTILQRSVAVEIDRSWITTSFASSAPGRRS